MEGPRAFDSGLPVVVSTPARFRHAASVDLKVSPSNLKTLSGVVNRLAGNATRPSADVKAERRTGNDLVMTVRTLRAIVNRLAGAAKRLSVFVRANHRTANEPVINVKTVRGVVNFLAANFNLSVAVL